MCERERERERESVCMSRDGGGMWRGGIGGEGGQDEVLYSHSPDPL